MNKKIKNKEDHKVIDDDSHECSSDESMHMLNNKDDTDLEPE